VLGNKENTVMRKFTIIIMSLFIAFGSAACLPQNPNLQYQVVQKDGTTVLMAARDIEAQNLGGQAIAFCLSKDGSSFFKTDYNTAKQVSAPCCPTIAGRTSGEVIKYNC
jgi:hypothetical protein